MGKNKHLSSEAKAAKALESRNKSYLPEDKLPPAPSACMVRKEIEGSLFEFCARGEDLSYYAKKK